MSQIYNVSTSTWTGDGASKTVTTGFQPSYVRIFDSTNATRTEKDGSMGATITIKTVTAGTQTADANSLITISSTGYVVAAAANTNAATFTGIAFR